MRAHARLVGVYRAVAFVSIGLEMLGGCAASRFLFGSAAPQPCLATLSAVDQHAPGLAGCPSDLSVPIVIFSRQSRARWFQPRLRSPMLGGCAASRFLFGSAAPQPCLATLSAVDQQAAGLAGCPSDLSVPIVIFSRQSRARWFQPPPLTRRRRVLEGHEARA